MKRYITIIASVLCAAGCADMLDTAPDNQVASGNMWTTEALADKGMVGLYSALYNKNMSDAHFDKIKSGINRAGIEALGFATDYYGGGHQVLLLSDAAKKASDFQLSYEWKFGYTIIHACNDAIANLHKAGLSEEKFNSYQAEAHFLRAWAYYRLNTLYWGVPIYLEPISNEECTKGQSSAAEVWNVVLDDLKYCIDCPDFPDKRSGRPSKGAAYALRGMTYMWLAAAAEGTLLNVPPTGEDATGYYNNAIDDFDKVKSCGYDFFSGSYGDIFKFENETSPEMIFTIQFSGTAGYSDNFQYYTGNWDCYTGWSVLKPSTEFIDSFENADGTDFVWSQVEGLEDWDALQPNQREVFFLRNGLENDDRFVEVLPEIKARIGEDTFEKYYLNEGNEERIRRAYADRDPRLKQIAIVPYEPTTCYVAGAVSPDRNVLNKELRWPFFRSNEDGGDIRRNNDFSGFCLYLKYCEHEQGRIQSRSFCHADWPLIRYTDVALQKAEALVKVNRTSEALAIVNDVRTRAGFTVPFSSSDPDELMEQIRYERRVEMCLEGIDFFDEIRWGTYKETKFNGQDQHGGTSWWGSFDELVWYYDSCMWPWSAPLAEIQKNSNLTRRDGWAY